MSVPNVLPSGTLIENIHNELADNNAGAISAYDVRHNMADIVASINWIVASGNFNSVHPFTGNDVKIKIENGQGGALIPESGVIFPIGGLQLEAYPGAQSISHTGLANLTVDVHTQYIPTNGSRTATANIGFDDHWINSSGNSTGEIFGGNNRGLKFEYLGNGTEVVHVGSGDYPTTGSGTYFKFDRDNSTISSAKGVAKAWLNFDAATDPPTVNSSFNIHELEKIDTGKYKIVFTSGTFGDNNYVAIGSSNARSTAASPEDFSINKVGLIQREGDDTSVATLRSITFVVMEDDQTPGTYVDAKINELVVYGTGPNEVSSPQPIVTVN